MGQYALKDVMDMDWIDYVTKKPIIHIDYAQTSSNQIQSTQTQVTGGRGDQLLYEFESKKVSTLQVNVPLVDPKLVAFLSGGTPSVGAANVFQRDVLTVDGTNKVTLSQTPVTGSIFLSKVDSTQPRDYGDEITLGDPSTAPNTYSISDKSVTLNTTSNPEGSQVVAFYQFATPETSTTIKIDADKFATFFTITGDGVWADQTTGVQRAVKMTVYKAKPQSNFTLSMDEANATTLQLNVDMYSTLLPDGRHAYVDYTLLT